MSRCEEPHGSEAVDLHLGDGVAVAVVQEALRLYMARKGDTVGVAIAAALSETLTDDLGVSA